MVVSYKKLWHLLLDKDMNKQDLRKLTGISSSTIAKLTNGENVNTDILVKICEVLNCNISDIMDILPNEEKKIEND